MSSSGQGRARRRDVCCDVSAAWSMALVAGPLRLRAVEQAEVDSACEYGLPVWSNSACLQPEACAAERLVLGGLLLKLNCHFSCGKTADLINVIRDERKFVIMVDRLPTMMTNLHLSLKTMLKCAVM
jgi:hypothetical protein